MAPLNMKNRLSCTNGDEKEQETFRTALACYVLHILTVRGMDGAESNDRTNTHPSTRR